MDDHLNLSALFFCLKGKGGAIKNNAKNYFVVLMFQSNHTTTAAITVNMFGGPLSVFELLVNNAMLIHVQRCTTEAEPIE